MVRIMLFIGILYFFGSANEHNNTYQCYEIIKKIDSLKNEKLNYSSSRIVSFILKPGYSYDNTKKEIDMKIKILKLKLNGCS